MKSGKKRRAKSRAKGRLRKRLLRAAIGAVCAGLLWCGFVMWQIYDYSPSETYAKSDAAIILGAALWRNEPSPALKERLDEAIRLYEAGAVDRLILSGGLGGLASDITEAEGMRGYLIARGVPEEKLLLETQARSTFQNLYYSKRLAEKENLNSFIIVTHDFHTARAMELADYIELGEEVQAAGVHSRVLSAFYNESREFLAYTKWKLDWLTLTLRLRSIQSML